MIRILKVGRLGFLKKVRIAFSLLRLSIKAVIFEHQRYFLFCLIFTLVQFATLFFTGFIDAKLRLSLLISESLAGLNFFEIAFESINRIDFWQIVLLGLFLCAELFSIYLLSSAVCYFALSESLESNYSLKSSFSKL